MKQISESRETLLEEISKNGLILWGAGPNVPSVIASLERLGFQANIVGIFDSTRELSGSEIHGIRIIPSREVKLLSYDKNIIIGCAGLNELYGYIVPEHLFYFKIIHRRALEICEELELPALDKLQNNVDLFADDLSKHIYLRRLELILSSVMFDASFKSDGGPYFNNDIIQSLDGRWLYAGAFNGRHLSRALEYQPDQKIVAIEPSPKMFDYLRGKFANNNTIDLKNYLLWSSSGKKIRFNDDSIHQGLGASVFQHAEFGEDMVIETITIDDLLNGRSVSHIALDVEGSEQKAIEGAKETISKFAPSCAVCLYHSLDDYLKLPSQLHRLSGEKKLYVRQHSCIPFIENVLYASR